MNSFTTLEIKTGWKCVNAKKNVQHANFEEVANYN